MDLFLDLKKLIERELTARNYTTKPSDDLDAVLLRYLNVLNRVPKQMPWDVKFSKEVSAKTQDRKIQKGIEQFSQEARAGKDLTSRLSRRFPQNPDYQDFMFYDWGMFHFHLGTKLNRFSGLTKSIGKILFAITDPCAAVMYLVDVLPHKDEEFTNQNLLKVVEENWPKVFDRYSLPVKELEWYPTNPEVGTLRKAGITAFIKTPGGRILFPMGGGITTAKTSARNREEADLVIATVGNIQRSIEQYEPVLKKHFSREHGLCWDELDIRLIEFGSVITIAEFKSKEVILRVPLRVTT